jgi:ribonuclease-3
VSYALLEEKIGHPFHDRARLELALTHKSFLNENPDCGRSHNERLEFLGDAVVDLAVGQIIMDQAPQASEGELSRRRATVVSEAALAEVALAVDLGQWLFLGRGEEQSGGRQKASVLADALEAIIGAIYLDAGFPAALEVVKRLFATRIAGAGRAAGEDWKTRLQEEAARRRLSVKYQVLSTSGPDHDKRFEVALLLGDVERARGQGKSKKEAEQKAAELALAWLAELAQKAGPEAAADGSPGVDAGAESDGAGVAPQPDSPDPPDPKDPVRDPAHQTMRGRRTRRPKSG